MAGTTIGKVSVKVSPDFTDFLAQVKSESELAGKAAKITIKVSVDDSATTKLQKFQKLFLSNDASVAGLNNKLNIFNKGLSATTSVLGSAASGMTPFTTVMSAVPAAAGVAGAALGAIAIAAAALPSVLAAAGTAGAVVALGMDGIKKAVQPLSPILTSLKSQVSEVFETGLKSQVAAIGQALPKLMSGFQDIAGSLTQVSGSFVGVVTSASGFAQIQT